MRRREMRTWPLTVTEAFNVTPRMRRLRFAGVGLHEMNWKPGQDVVLSIPGPHGETARRHYTIRHLNGDSIDIDFVLHGDSPATRFARSAQPSVAIDAAGPRGRTYVRPDAEHHVFVGDETAMPGIFAMLETLTPSHRADVILEVADDGEKQEPHTKAQLAINWIVRGEDSPLARLRDLNIAPDGAHAYLLGETAKVRDQRHYLVERGFNREQLTCEGYWRPGRVGGHDHV